MKHWLDHTDVEMDAMTQKEKDECIAASLHHDIEMMELVKYGLWVRHYDQCVYRLPLCHDFGIIQ
jgi:hypothetical protein